jgi:hypothetical protein
MTWLSGWAKRTKGTLDSAGAKVSEDLTHFAVPLKISASCGINGDDMSRVFDEVGSDYLKIAITTSDGITQLYGEVEKWDATTEDALIWVSKSDWTISSDADEEIYIYYDYSQTDNTSYIGTPGNRTEVWDSNFLAVYHMAEDPSNGVLKDSTANGYDGIVTGGMTSEDRVSWEYGFAWELDGDDDYIDLHSDLSLPLQSTVQAIHQETHGTQSQYAAAFEQRNTSTLGGRYATLKENIWGMYNNIGVSYDTGGNRSCVVGTKDGVLAEAFLDGVSQGIYDGLSTTEPNINATIGVRRTDNGGYDADDTWVGKIDEVRISSVIRSDIWIKADYHAQTDTLLTWGAEELAGDTAIEDISLDLYAYYQARVYLAAMLAATDGTVLQDLETILRAYGQSVDDLAAALAAYFQDRADISAHLKALATGRKDLPAALQAMGLGRADLPAQLKALAWAGKDLSTMLAAVTPLVFSNLGLALSATDGTATNDLSTVLAAVKRAPQYKSVVAQRIKSVISEVT